MPNYVSNSLTVEGLNSDQQVNLKNLLESGSFLETLVPLPSDSNLDERTLKFTYWGCKWDIDGITAEIDGNTLSASFNTSWSPPIPGFVFVSKIYPKAQFILTYDQAVNDCSGVAVMQDGRFMSIIDNIDSFLQEKHPDFYQELEAAREQGDECDLIDEIPYQEAQENLWEQLDKIATQMMGWVKEGSGDTLDHLHSKRIRMCEEFNRVHQQEVDKTKTADPDKVPF